MSKARTASSGPCCVLESFPSLRPGTAAWSAATTTAAWTTTTPAAIVVARRRTRSACRLAYRDRRAFNAVKVGFGFLIELLGAVFVEIFSAFDKNRALVGGRLTLVKLVPRPCGRRRRGGSLQWEGGSRRTEASPFGWRLRVTKVPQGRWI